MEHCVISKTKMQKDMKRQSGTTNSSGAVMQKKQRERGGVFYFTARVGRKLLLFATSSVKRLLYLSTTTRIFFSSAMSEAEGPLLHVPSLPQAEWDFIALHAIFAAAHLPPICLFPT